MLTHFSTIHSVIHYAWVMELTEEDRTIIAVPMSHVTGVIALIDTMVYCAGALVIMPAFKAARLHRSRRAAPDHLHGDRAGHVQPLPARAEFRGRRPLGLAGLRLRRRDHARGHGRAHRTEAATPEADQLLWFDGDHFARRLHAAGGSDRSEGIRRADGAVRTHHRHGRGGDRGSLWLAGGSLHRRRDGRARIFQQPRSHRARVQGRLLEVGRPRHHGREGLPQDHRPDQGRDQPRRVQDLRLGGRKHPARPSGGDRGRGRGQALPGPRRTGPRLRRAASTRRRPGAHPLLRQRAVRLQGARGFHRLESTLPRNANGKVLKRDLRQNLVA